MRLVVTIAALFVGGLLGNMAQPRLGDMLSSNTDFHDQWIHLIETQDRQWREQASDFPLEDLSDALTECAIPEGGRDHSDSLHPADIRVYVEMGHLSRFCPRNTTELLEGVLEPCTQPGYTMESPSLDKFLRIFSDNLTIIESTLDPKLSVQTKLLVDRFNSTAAWNDVWKLVVIMPSVQDGEAVESEQPAVEVLETIEALHEVIPNRTLVVVLRTSGLGIWQDASHTHQACRSMLHRFRLHSKFNSASVWDQIETICEWNYKSELFSVQILPLLKDAALTNLPGNMMDLSVLGYDCAHFSERGLSLLHISIWNSLLTRHSERSHKYRPAFAIPQCADPQCPFFRTSNNEALCFWTPPVSMKDESQNGREKILALVTMVMAVVPCVVLVIMLCRGRGASYYTKEPRWPVPLLKPYGDDLTSIKYIDEDSICQI